MIIKPFWSCYFIADVSKTEVHREIKILGIFGLKIGESSF
jgi:hypothetical protein